MHFEMPKPETAVIVSPGDARIVAFVYDRTAARSPSMAADMQQLRLGQPDLDALCRLRRC